MSERRIPAPIAEIAAEIESTVSGFSDSDARWSWLLRLAKEHPAMDASLRDDRFLVKGCATRLYLVPKFEEGRLWFETDTDAGDSSPLIVRGLAALAQRLFSGQTPADVLAFDPEFFRRTGIHGALSATRANGFASLLRQIRLYADVFGRMAAAGKTAEAPSGD